MNDMARMMKDLSDVESQSRTGKSVFINFDLQTKRPEFA